MGKRQFNGQLRFGHLRVQGAAFTFNDLDDTSSFAPCNFAFQTGQFTAAFGKDAGGSIKCSIEARENAV